MRPPQRVPGCQARLLQSLTQRALQGVYSVLAAHGICFRLDGGEVRPVSIMLMLDVTLFCNFNFLTRPLSLSLSLMLQPSQSPALHLVAVLAASVDLAAPHDPSRVTTYYPHPLNRLSHRPPPPILVSSLVEHPPEHHVLPVQPRDRLPHLAVQTPRAFQVEEREEEVAVVRVAVSAVGHAQHAAANRTRSRTGTATGRRRRRRRNWTVLHVGVHEVFITTCVDRKCSRPSGQFRNYSRLPAQCTPE